MKRPVPLVVVGRLLRCQRGATALEYGFILALITIGSMVALMNLAGGVVGLWTKIAARVSGL